MPELSPDLARDLIRSAVVLVAAIVAGWLVIRLGSKWVSRSEERDMETAARTATLWLMIRRLAMIVLGVLVVLVLFSVWGFSLAPFLAVGTVVGAAIGFGAQDLVKDFIAGFFILAEDQFRIGDVVTVAETNGVVEDIQLRVTVLRDLEGNVHYVPNGQIKVSSNFTSEFAQPVIDVPVAYDTDVDRALDVLRDELEALAGDTEWEPQITGEVEVLGVTELGESGVVLRARLTTLAGMRWTVRREALRRIKKRFDAEGITIPFPQLTVHRVD
jgi:small conductance mechanosensitive channel